MQERRPGNGEDFPRSPGLGLVLVPGLSLPLHLSSLGGGVFGGAICKYEPTAQSKSRSWAQFVALLSGGGWGACKLSLSLERKHVLSLLPQIRIKCTGPIPLEPFELVSGLAAQSRPTAPPGDASREC